MNALTEVENSSRLTEKKSLKQNKQYFELFDLTYIYL